MSSMSKRWVVIALMVFGCGDAKSETSGARGSGGAGAAGGAGAGAGASWGVDAGAGASGAPAIPSDGGGPAGDGSPAPSDNFKIFNPADYAGLGYDETGASESSAAFQKAIDEASAYAKAHGDEGEAAGLFVPPPMKNAAGIEVGPNRPQAIVRANPHSVFKLDDVYLKPNVRLEIDASDMLIPIESDNSVLIFLAQTSGTSKTYLTNVTVTSYGSSSTFTDTGRRCDAVGKPSPCTLEKKVLYPDMTFSDGKSWKLPDPTALEYRYLVDRDVRRYPDADKSIGNTPRGGGIKARQVKNFLVEKMLQLAHAGEILYPTDNPPGPGGIGSNTYPATAGNGFSTDAAGTPSGGTDDYSENAVMPRNGTIQLMHCEDCTRGYGILEIHSGVDLEYRYISTRGGIAVRWENGGTGRSTRQTAEQVVGIDCNTPVLMSAHEDHTAGLGVPGPEQDSLRASFVKAIGCDNGIRSESTGGTNVNSSISKALLYAGGIDGASGGKAQVIICRGGGGSGPATPDGCSKFGVAYYDDDAWIWKPAQIAINNNAGVSLDHIACDPSTFAKPNAGGSCSALP